jgi:hypothetical protein
VDRGGGLRDPDAAGQVPRADLGVEVDRRGATEQREQADVDLEPLDVERGRDVVGLGRPGAQRDALEVRAPGDEPALDVVDLDLVLLRQDLDDLLADALERERPLQREHERDQAEQDEPEHAHQLARARSELRDPRHHEPPAFGSPEPCAPSAPACGFSFE